MASETKTPSSKSSSSSTVSKVRVIVRVRPFLPHQFPNDNHINNISPIPCASLIDANSEEEVTVHLKDQATRWSIHYPQTNSYLSIYPFIYLYFTAVVMSATSWIRSTDKMITMWGRYLRKKWAIWFPDYSALLMLPFLLMALLVAAKLTPSRFPHFPLRTNLELEYIIICVSTRLLIMVCLHIYDLPNPLKCCRVEMGSQV